MYHVLGHTRAGVRAIILVKYFFIIPSSPAFAGAGSGLLPEGEGKRLFQQPVKTAGPTEVKAERPKMSPGTIKRRTSNGGWGPSLH
jgi:hypothetical protein